MEFHICFKSLVCCLPGCSLLYYCTKDSFTTIDDRKVDFLFQRTAQQSTRYEAFPSHLLWNKCFISDKFINLHFPSFAYSLTPISTAHILFPTEHSSNQLRPKLYFTVKQMSQKIHFASVMEICKKSLSGRQSFQTFASFMIDKYLATRRTLIFCCVNPKGQTLSYQEPGGWKHSFRDQKFTTYFFCSILFSYLKISSSLRLFKSSSITSTSAFHKLHLLGLIHTAFFVLCPNGYLFLKTKRCSRVLQLRIFTCAEWSNYFIWPPPLATLPSFLLSSCLELWIAFTWLCLHWLCKM